MATERLDNNDQSVYIPEDYLQDDPKVIKSTGEETTLFRSNSASFDPNAWFDRHPKPTYSLTNAIYSTGRKGTTPSVINKARHELRQMGITTEKGLSRELAIELALKIGPVDNIRSRNGSTHIRELLTQLGIEISRNVEDTTEHPDDSPLAKIALGAWVESESRRKKMEVTEDGVKVRQELGMEMTGRVLASIDRINLSIDLEKNPHIALSTLKAPKNYKKALNYLSEPQAASFLAEIIRETIERLSEENPEANNNQAKMVMVQLEEVASLGIEPAEVIKFVYNHYGVKPHKDYQKPIEDPKLRLNLMRRTSSHAGSRL
ncbi:MAG TPA: hypothetical protein VHE53_02465 [Patescibacteria group bacterium]|nr:hypothetical protein [Patescibacteria group bacterium]